MTVENRPEGLFSTFCCILRPSTLARVFDSPLFSPSLGTTTCLNMKTFTCIAIVAILSSSSIMASETCILKARYRPVEGTDIEHGQGAIERNELPHYPLEPVLWLIRVPEPGDPTEWQRRLNTTVDPSLGSFRVEQPTADELRRVEVGEIRFQQ